MPVERTAFGTCDAGFGEGQSSGSSAVMRDRCPYLVDHGDDGRAGLRDRHIGGECEPGGSRSVEQRTLEREQQRSLLCKAAQHLEI